MPRWRIKVHGLRVLHNHTVEPVNHDTLAGLDLPVAEDHVQDRNTITRHRHIKWIAAMNNTDPVGPFALPCHDIEGTGSAFIQPA